MTDDETTHTPSPWQIRHTDSALTRVGPPDEGWDVAEVHLPDGHMSTPIREVPAESHFREKANAKLIAAAPDLLAAARKAEDVLSWVEDEPPTAQREEVEALKGLRDAIDKAT